MCLKKEKKKRKQRKENLRSKLIFITNDKCIIFFLNVFNFNINPQIEKHLIFLHL